MTSPESESPAEAGPSTDAGPSSDAGRVADGVRAAILAGDLAPDQRLVEAELSERYHASRGSVRTALLSLAHDGLVERIANRGARVRAVSVDEAIEITEVRMVVEGLCAAKAAERITEPEIAELLDLGDAMRKAVAAGEVIVYSQLNQRLHDRIREIAAQPVAAEVLARLRAQNVRHQFRLALRPGRPQVSLPEHLAIIEEICARSPGGAERATRRHILSVLGALRPAL